MVSGGDVAANLAQAEPLIAAAAAEGARLVLLPEYFGILGARATDKVAVREPDGDGPQQAFLARLARAHGIFARRRHGAARLRRSGARAQRAASSTVPTAQRVARYDKIHLFAFARGDESYDERRTIEPGDRPLAFDAPCGRVGLSVCYDLRFPELYRALGDCALILVPAAFTATTGAAHWHLLLRARAVENQCYVLAAAQGGMHPGGRRTYGHSLLVDPWGEIVAERDERARASSSATSTRRASPRCAPSCPRSRTACCADAGGAYLPRSRTSTAPPPPAWRGASQ